MFKYKLQTYFENEAKAYELREKVNEIQAKKSKELHKTDFNLKNKKWVQECGRKSPENRR